MGAGWIVLIVLGGLVLLLALGLAVGGTKRRDRAADLAAEFWDWLKLGR
jgi:hypothetical protein